MQHISVRDSSCALAIWTRVLFGILFLLQFGVLPAHAAGWTVAASLATTRYGHTATPLPNGKLLVAGGGNISSGTLSSAELYDPATNTWSAVDSLATARLNHTATLLPNGKLLVAGGYNGSYPSSAELYDPATNTWSTAGSLATARRYHSATLLPNGKLLVVGGYNSSSNELSSTELYDPATNTWSAAGSLATARLNHTATLLPNGKLLVAGGDSSSGTLSSAELYDPATSTWSAAGSLATARYGHTATLLPNGKVLVAGGNSSSSYLSSAELYDPATNTWSAAGSLATARYGHTATLLPNGKVLVAGGNSSSGYLSSAERYDLGLGIADSRRPVVSTVGSLTAGSRGVLTLTGTQLTGDAEGSSGNTQSSAANLPVIQLRRLDNDAQIAVLPSTVSATAYTSRAMGLLPAGQYRLTVISNGVPSMATLVSVPAPELTITPATLPVATYHNNYNQTLTASGGTSMYYFSLLSGSLPPGMALDWSGLLTGTPSQATTYNFTVRVTDSTATTIGPLSGQRSYAFVVNPTIPGAPTLLRLVSGNELMKVFFSPPAGTGVPLTYTATCTDGVTPRTGTGLDSPVTVTGLTNGVSYTCTVSASNSAGASPASGGLAKVVRPVNIAPILLLLE